MVLISVLAAIILYLLHLVSNFHYDSESDIYIVAEPRCYEIQHDEASFASEAVNLRSAMLSNAVDPTLRPNKTVLVDNVQQSLALTGWLTLKWNDNRLAWQPSSFGDIQEIHFKPSEIWKPEVTDICVINDDNLQLTMSNTGDILWEPPSLYTTHCEIDVTYYPFGRQKCIIELTSWSMNKDQLEPDLASDDIDTEGIRNNGEWIIVSTSVKDNNLFDNKPDGTVANCSQLNFILVLECRPAFYAINFILPIMLSSSPGEKVYYVLTMILAIAVLLTLIADSLPHTSLTANAGNKVFPNGSNSANNEIEGPKAMDRQPTETQVFVDDGEEQVYTLAELADISDRFWFWVFITLTYVCTLSCLIALAFLGRKDFAST
ncbi:hypothetical protein ACJMK2_014172 [Sinanodonta woodiana]|uniref:Neurotransmitter-gated ion-channel ligand-binding domain-containing protein n=1 Tax=Sinanodonta woodiana TaxID=1069815 RepID=A0ABD3V095_SINWO